MSQVWDGLLATGGGRPKLNLIAVQPHLPFQEPAVSTRAPNKALVLSTATT